MKKLVAALAAGIFIVGAATTTVSAEEHEVQKGESLWEIADKYDTTVEELTEINDLKSTVIHPKQLLFINNIYSVKQGDTLIGIGKEYNITVDELKEWNDLKNDIIVIGQDLKINGVNVSQEDSVPAETVEAPKQEKETEKQAEEKTATVKTEQVEEGSEPSSEQSPEGETISVTATAYTAKCDGCSGVTYTGVDLNSNPNAKVIAVDPNVIPLGSEVYVEGYGYATAADIGGAIKGDKIDLHVPTKEEAINWGAQQVNVTIVK
ncbi:LysM peptidoglycan-binding and 3D domain-containing protein [Oceanobacillus polygoni]|uniref:3D (Asp-Asp-Asp) domain-containing protein/LysM repeat protein n=1 Tax=Oceanobacillus polygoni TaxID=1235259 RepID=A0A9X1CA83_9BACI|nr:3D domain-containing protein [Oceanobacillus polygoni]MBP2076299.1 3D (Asp-Asp-Asp) domain-containing protein/LysM repeat protein [Oceanobacillus polygoni]